MMKHARYALSLQIVEDIQEARSFNAADIVLRPLTPIKARSARGWS